MANPNAWLRLARFALQRAIAIDEASVVGDGRAVVAEHARVAVHRIDKALAREPRPRPSPPSVSPTDVVDLVAGNIARGHHPGGASTYTCTCGYSLRGLELERFLDDLLPGPAPVSMTCPQCRGVAVRSTGGDA